MNFFKEGQKKRFRCQVIYELKVSGNRMVLLDFIINRKYSIVTTAKERSLQNKNNSEKWDKKTFS
jgi:hypothetical protein